MATRSSEKYGHSVNPLHIAHLQQNSLPGSRMPLAIPLCPEKETQRAYVSTHFNLRKRPSGNGDVLRLPRFAEAFAATRPVRNQRRKINERWRDRNERKRLKHDGRRAHS